MYDQITLDGSTRQQKLYDYSIEILRLAEPPEGYYLCTSFGKDSIAVQRLCDEAGVKYDAHHNITGIDPPELVYFGRKHYPDVKRHMYRKIELNGKMVPGSMWNLIEKKGIFPMRGRRFCCEYLKEDGGLGRRCVMGIRSAESDRRKKSWAPLSDRGITKKQREAGNGLRLFDTNDIQTSLQSCVVRNKLTVCPMYFWESDDLWDFIKDRKLPYCSLYDEGFSRLGCVGCPEAREAGRRRDFERWPEFYKLYLNAAQKLIDDGRFSGKGSAEAIMEWWLSDKVQAKQLDGQILMEEAGGNWVPEEDE